MQLRWALLLPVASLLALRARADDMFDYVIVGGGTAGMTLGARLSENPKVTVAVVEAGGDYKTLPINTIMVDMPGGDVVGSGGSFSDSMNNLVDWGFKTVPQKGANNREVRYARGKTIGGSSTRNYLVYQRPTRGAMDKWVQLTGDKFWSWDNRRDAFARSMTFYPPNDDKRLTNTSYKQSDFPHAGPLSISYPSYSQPFSRYVKPALNEIGYSNQESLNDGDILGVSWASATIQGWDGKRSTSRSFYEQAKSRPNLRVYMNNMAQKILFDSGATPRALGVQTKQGRVMARKEVIVSGGAFHSPQLLMVSGIGPKATLDKIGVKTIVDLPGVGQNMQDHIFVGGPSYSVNVETLTRTAADPFYLGQKIQEFQTTQSGPMTNNQADMIGFERLTQGTLDSLNAGVLSQLPGDWPHLEVFSAAGLVRDLGDLWGLNGAVGVGGKNYATIMNALVAPRSRGSVTVSSANTDDMPVIDPAWLTDPVDQRVAVHGFKRTREAFATKAIRPVLNGGEYFPGGAVRSDAEILNFVRSNLMTVWHASCTCAMGKREAKGVLDSRLKVYGVQGLRVVDASSFPILPPGHPQSVVYMLAESAAELIKAGK